MSLCRRVPCAVWAALGRLRLWAQIGAIGLPLLASGCGGVMQLAGADLLSASGEELASAEDSPRAGTARPRPTPSLAAAENAHDTSEDRGDHDVVRAQNGSDAGAAGSNDAGALAALLAIEVSGQSSGRSPGAAPARSADNAGTAGRSVRRPEPAAPTGPVSLFADDPPPAAARTRRREPVTLAAAQEEVPAAPNVGPPLAEPVPPNATPSGGQTNTGDLSPTETMTVEQIVNTAIREHPLLRQRQEEIRLAVAELVGAGLLPNPQLVIDTDTPTQEAGPTELSTRLTFTIPLGGRIGLAQQVADFGIRRAQMLASYETEVIVSQAVAAALEVLYWQELVVLQADQVGLANQLVEKALPPRFSESDQVSARVSARSLELQRLDSVRQLRAARMRLSKAIGLNPPRPIRVNAVLADNPAPDLQLETLLAAVRENRPEIAEGQLSVVQARWQRTLAQAEAIPDLELGPRFQDRFRSPTDSMGARFNMDLPLFDRNQDGLAESDATMRVNQATLGVTEMTTLSDVAEAFAQLPPIQSRLLFYRRELPELAASAEQAIRASFEAGRIDINRVINEQQRLVRLRIDHLNLKYQYNRLRALVELYAGRSLEQLAEMEAAAARDAARDNMEGAKPPTDNPFQDEPPPTSPDDGAPARPRARKDAVGPDSRTAGEGPRSGVAPTSAIDAGKSSAVSPLDYVKRVILRKKPPSTEPLPYSAVKPSAAAQR